MQEHTHMHSSKVNKFQDSSFCSQDQQKNHALSHSQVYSLLTSLVTASGSSGSLLVG